MHSRIYTNNKYLALGHLLQLHCRRDSAAWQHFMLCLFKRLCINKKSQSGEEVCVILSLWNCGCSCACTEKGLLVGLWVKSFPVHVRAHVMCHFWFWMAVLDKRHKSGKRGHLSRLWAGNEGCNNVISSSLWKDCAGSSAGITGSRCKKDHSNGLPYKSVKSKLSKAFWFESTNPLMYVWYV